MFKEKSVIECGNIEEHKNEEKYFCLTCGYIGCT